MTHSQHFVEWFEVIGLRMLFLNLNTGHEIFMSAVGTERWRKNHYCSLDLDYRVSKKTIDNLLSQLWSWVTTLTLAYLNIMNHRKVIIATSLLAWHKRFNQKNHQHIYCQTLASIASSLPAIPLPPTTSRRCLCRCFLVGHFGRWKTCGTWSFVFNGFKVWALLAASTLDGCKLWRWTWFPPGDAVKLRVKMKHV